MTLLTICQEALEELSEFEVPDTIVGNVNPTATKILALANREGRLLSRRTRWQAMVKEHTFTTTATVASYTPPTDMRYFITDTHWDRTNFWEMRGPSNPQDWQELKSGIITEGTRRWIRFQGDALLVHPTPSVTGDTLVFEYLSENWCQSSGGTGQTKWAADSDTGVISEELMLLGLKWRWLASKQVSYAEDFNEYEDAVQRDIANDGGLRNLNMTGIRLTVNDSINVPEGDFG